MRLILGIGNPGKRYQHNRHNVGFMFLDYLANKYSISFIPSRNDYYFAEHKIGENYFSLVKPSNYVNNSGFSAMQAISNYNASIDDLLVVHDDVYLETGTFRLKLSGGDGGHKGINSIIYNLSSEDVVRIRIGVGGKDFSQDNIAEYVLSDFNEDEKLLNEAFENCSLLAEAFICGGKKQLLDVNSKLVKPNNNSEN
ncbi:MAG TPA: aminoacyl-tRNA hydrolase [Ignavibacteriaceae bacterium]